jgi:hypothetical protein
MAEEEEKKST